MAASYPHTSIPGKSKRDLKMETIVFLNEVAFHLLYSICSSKSVSFIHFQREQTAQGPECCGVGLIGAVLVSACHNQKSTDEKKMYKIIYNLIPQTWLLFKFRYIYSYRHFSIPWNTFISFFSYRIVSPCSFLKPFVNNGVFSKG